MQLRNITSVLVVVLVTALYGCDSDDNALTDTSASMPAPGETPVDPITVDGLAGQWQRPCAASTTSADYSTADMTIADNVATITQSIFTDSACTTPASPAVIVTENSLVFDNTTSNTSLGDASNLESTVESRTVDGVSSTDGINAITYDILLITNNTLYFGDKSGENNGTTTTLRPLTLDQSLSWSNQ